MNAISVVVVPEVQQLPFEISGAPERDLIQELSPYRADQSFDERMRERHLGYRLDLRHVENAQIRLPAMELEQRVMIAAEVARPSELSSDCIVEHAADGGTIEHACTYTETNNSAGELIHHDQHPVGSQDE